MVISMFLSKNFNKFESERLEEELGHAIALFSQTKKLCSSLWVYTSDILGGSPGWNYLHLFQSEKLGT